jgi:ribosome-binding protein aMBF1 (putative translation factor)
VFFIGGALAAILSEHAGGQEAWMDDIVSFGYWVRRRKALDLRQGDLAWRIGCAAATIQEIESDERRPSRQIVE